MTTLNQKLPSYEKKDSSQDVKRKIERNTFNSIDGKIYSIDELKLMASHRISEILLYNILLELRKK